VRRLPAPAKINLALVVGPPRGDGKHEVATILQAIDLADRMELAPASGLRVTGFPADTLVERALRLIGERAGVEPGFAAHIDKRIPVAAGLGGASSDAATALRLANELLPRPLAADELERLGSELGSDVPFFLAPGPKLGEADGTELTALDLPQDYWVVIVAPHGERKESTRQVYEAFDRRCGAEGFEERRAALDVALRGIRRPRDLARLPPNDLASSPLAAELLGLGAFRADVTGAGPAVYGLFHHREAADQAAARLRPRGRVWVTVPAWYV
jgi:4-diphosphocytidyl-2-C-methyl-D-erythritol kinase